MQKNQQIEEKKSSCCHAPLVTYSGDEGTGWYGCSKCHEPCDVANSEKVKSSHPIEADIVKKKVAELDKLFTPRFLQIAKYADLGRDDLYGSECAKVLSDIESHFAMALNEALERGKEIGRDKPTVCPESCRDWEFCGQCKHTY